MLWQHSAVACRVAVHEHLGMRAVLVVAALAIGCHGAPADVPDATPIAIDAPADAARDRLKGIYDEVDGAHVVQLVKEMSGAMLAMIGGAPVALGERYSDAGRQRFRDYWTQYMTGLGLEVHALDYQAAGHPRSGTNLEAVLPGASADSFIVIVHYDSMGPPGMETQNPGADDDMSGMAIELETARILVAHKSELAYTVRFVASDEEEVFGLAGARAYASHIKAAAMTGGFALVAAIDDEQSGWSCQASGSCDDNTWPAFDVFSCSGNGAGFSYQAMGDRFAAIAQTYSPLHVVRGCMSAHSDHYAMWEIGVPTVVYSEHSPFNNPHFDQNGGDTFDLIDTSYLVSIARVGITFQATLAGITK